MEPIEYWQICDADGLPVFDFITVASGAREPLSTREDRKEAAVARLETYLGQTVNRKELYVYHWEGNRE